jgi:septal ring factor EnvC (AmiA/AmiB activator)
MSDDEREYRLTRLKQAEESYQKFAKRLTELDTVKQELQSKLRSHDGKLQDLPIQTAKLEAWAAERRRLLDALEVVNDLMRPAQVQADRARDDWQQTKLNYAAVEA